MPAPGATGPMGAIGAMETADGDDVGPGTAPMGGRYALRARRWGAVGWLEVLVLVAASVVFFLVQYRQTMATLWPRPRRSMPRSA